MATSTTTPRTPAPPSDTAEPRTGNYFVSAYPPFSCWTEQGVQRFSERLESSSPAAANLGLYCHIPFCVKRCDYCYYLSYDDRLPQIERYLDALLRECEMYARKPAIVDRRVTFAYFGGGTPSLLSPAQIRRLFGRLQELMPWAPREVTFECAPQSVTDSKLQALRDMGVSRISLGAQQLDDRVLQLNGRIHQVGDVERAWAATRRVGFPVVNLDLIAGLAGETDESFDRSLERVIEWAPESVTVYLLEIPQNTPLFHATRSDRLSAELPTWEEKRRRLERAFARLEAAGYAVRSAYAAVRDPEHHRFVYQDDQYRGADLLGLGVSSFTYLDGLHQQNLAALTTYLESVERGRLPLWRAYDLGPRDRLVREFILQLKLGGVDRQAFRDKFGVEVAAEFATPLEEFRARGWISLEGSRVAMTRAGLLRVDRLLPAFYLPEHQGVRYN